MSDKSHYTKPGDKLPDDPDFAGDLRWAVASMIEQEMSRYPGPTYFSGFISAHAEFLRVAARLGVAEILGDDGGRAVSTKLLPPYARSI